MRLRNLIREAVISEFRAFSPCSLCYLLPKSLRAAQISFGANSQWGFRDSDKLAEKCGAEK